MWGALFHNKTISVEIERLNDLQEILTDIILFTPVGFFPNEGRFERATTVDICPKI